MGIERASTLPASSYADSQHHLDEVDRIFRSGWSCVGVVDDVATPGSYLTARVAGTIPVIVVRDHDGSLHGYFNVCRHRGAPVAEGCGTRAMLQCPYHAWVYGLDGSLRRWSGMDDAVGFDPAGFSLHRIGVATWSRFVFVRPSPTGPDFDLGPLALAVDPYPIDEMELAIREGRTGAFNWKVLVENYSENFHTPFVHPELTVRGWDYPIVTDGAIALAWDRPQQPRNASEQALVTATPLDHAWAGVARDQIDDVFIAGVYLTVFPNLLVSLFPRYLSAIRLTPLSVNRTQIDYYRCWHPSVAPARRTADHEATLVVVEQDLRICEQVQLGYDGGIDTDGRLSPEHEAGVHHVHELLRSGERVDQ